ncbi:MAG: hypothetical protein HON23_00445 [Rickettsiales bacterium]|jgi:hypothetical protein|nr:hypothetical protein [Rickettsiales bacterium]
MIKIIGLTLIFLCHSLYAGEVSNDIAQIDPDAESTIVESEKKYNFMSSAVYDYHIKDISKGNSILYSKKQISQLDKILSALLLGEAIDQEDLFEKDEPEKEREKEKEEVKEAISNNSIRFYLNSILYSGPDSWIVWVNGKKYNQDNRGAEEFQIEKVTRNRVAIKWVTGYTKFVYILKKAADNPDLPRGMIIRIVDNIANVSFYLETNQKFLLSKNLTITEGR